MHEIASAWTDFAGAFWGSEPIWPARLDLSGERSVYADWGGIAARRRRSGNPPERHSLSAPAGGRAAGTL